MKSHEKRPGQRCNAAGPDSIEVRHLADESSIVRGWRHGRIRGLKELARSREVFA